MLVNGLMFFMQFWLRLKCRYTIHGFVFVHVLNGRLLSEMDSSFYGSKVARKLIGPAIVIKNTIYVTSFVIVNRSY